MTFDEWQAKHGPNGGAFDIEMQRAGWNGRQKQVENLTQLVLRLSQLLRKVDPAHELPEKALDYVQREGLCGSPLRGEPDTPASAA